MSHLQAKLELVTGAACNSMIVEVYSKDDKFVCRLDDDDALLGSYPVDDGARLHVILGLLFLSVTYCCQVRQSVADCEN